MYCRIEQIDETCTFIKDHVKKSIKSHCLVLSILCKTKEKKLFETFVSNLQLQYLHLLHKFSEGSVLRRVQEGIGNVDSMA